MSSKVTKVTCTSFSSTSSSTTTTTNPGTASGGGGGGAGPPAAAAGASPSHVQMDRDSTGGYTVRRAEATVGPTGDVHRRLQVEQVLREGGGGSRSRKVSSESYAAAE